LHRQAQDGLEAEAWAAWLEGAARGTSGIERRLLLLKGSLLREEWAARCASRALAKQQAALLQLQAGAEAKGHVLAASRALEEATGAAGELLEALPGPGGELAAAMAAAEKLRPRVTQCLRALLAAHRHLAQEGEDASQVRACILALAALGLVELSGLSACGSVGPSGAPSRLNMGDVEASWRSLEERCERRAARRSLRQCARQMAAIASQWSLELLMLQAEIRCMDGV